jgi:antitoxin ParD1/3/4
MTLTVTLDLPPDVEAELRMSIAHGDTERVRQVLTDALIPTVEALLQDATAPLGDHHAWDSLADQLIATFATAVPANLPVLSDYATSRAGMYEEHP